MLRTRISGLGPANALTSSSTSPQFAGKTLILYNDSGAPVPAFDTRYDYYTGDPDQTTTGGAPTTLPGYGPNIRTVMQIQVANNTPAPLTTRPLCTRPCPWPSPLRRMLRSFRKQPTAQPTAPPIPTVTPVFRTPRCLPASLTGSHGCDAGQRIHHCAKGDHLGAGW